MKILITSIVDLRKTLHNRLHQFVKYLSQNHELTVVSINDWWKAGQTDFTLYSQGFKDILNNVNIEYFTQLKISPIYQEVISVANLSKILKEIDYQKFDVHLNYSLLSGYFVSRKVNSAGIKSVYDIADDLLAMVRASPQIPTILRPIAELLAKTALRRNIAGAERITTTTASLRDSLGIPVSKAVIIRNGVDTELFNNNYPSQPLWRKLGLDQAFVLGYVGVLREWVNLEPVFSAVKNLEGEGLNDIRILILGEEGGLAKNKTLAQKYSVLDRVIFTGTVHYTQVPEYISCMDVCLLPFKNNAVSQNALPLKLFEYMACGKPVISTKLKGVMEAVGNRVFYCSDTDELMARISELYKNVEMRRRIGSEGRKFVQETYSWSRICSRLEEVLLEVASARQGA